MYLVTFRLDPGEYNTEFHESNDVIQAIAEDTDGYLGKRTGTTRRVNHSYCCPIALRIH